MPSPSQALAKKTAAKTAATKAPAKAPTAPKAPAKAATKVTSTKAAKAPKEVVKETPAAAPAPEAAATEDANFATMSAAKIDAVLKENGIDAPEGWSGMDLKAKRQYMIDNYSTEETPPATETAPETASEPETAEAATETTEAAGEASGEAETASNVVPLKNGNKAKKLDLLAPQNGDVMASDDFAALVAKLENIKEGEARSLAGRLTEATDFTRFKLGGVLSIIQKKGWFGQHKSFREYIEIERGMDYRTAMYWVAIYKSMVTSGVQWDDVKMIPWTKLKEIAEVLTTENVAEWVKIAGENTTLMLKEIVKNHKAAKSDKDTHNVKDSAAVSTMTFKVHEDQKGVISAAVEKAMEAASTEVKTVALERICSDYLGGTDQSLVARLKAAGLEKVGEALEAAFPEYEFEASAKGEAQAAAA